MPCWCLAWAMRPARNRSRRAGSWRLWSARSSGYSSTSRSHLSATRDASRAVTAFAKEIAALLSVAAEALEGGPIPGDLAAQWLEDARRLTRHAPRWTGCSPTRRRANDSTCGAATPPAGRTALKPRRTRAHLDLSAHTLPRHARRHAAAYRRAGRPRLRHARAVQRRGAHGRHGDGALGVRPVRTPPRRGHGRAATRRAGQRAGIPATPPRRARRRTHRDPRIRQGLWELNSALLTTVDRMLLELDAATITVDPDQRRMRQALGRLRAAVHDATHRPDSRGASGQGPPESTERP